MSKPNNERFQHAVHNEKACLYLKLDDTYRDWVITTAFYSALHFVSSKIFPFKAPAIGGKETNIENLDQYFNYTKSKQKSINKHELLLSLVDQHFTDETYSHYDWLLSNATTARYKNFQHLPEVANRAIDYLQKIKKSCA